MFELLGQHPHVDAGVASGKSDLYQLPGPPFTSFETAQSSERKQKGLQSWFTRNCVLLELVGPTMSALNGILPGSIFNTAQILVVCP